MANQPRPRPILVEIDGIHYCWGIDTSEKAKGARIRCLAPVSADAKTTTNVWELKADEVDRAIELIRRHPQIRHVSVLFKTGETAQMCITQDKSLIISSIPKEKAVLFEPTVTEAGKDTISLLVQDDRTMSDLLALLEKKFEIKLRAKKYLEKPDQSAFDFFRTSGFLQLKTLSTLLTSKQREVFDLACRDGYYEMPQKTTIDEMAAKLGIHPNTFADHLRKAEAKLLPIFADVLRKF